MNAGIDFSFQTDTNNGPSQYVFGGYSYCHLSVSSSYFVCLSFSLFSATLTIVF